MYGEPRRIRAVAERLEARSGDLRREADRLAADCTAAAWASVAADRMREGAARVRRDVDAIAHRYDEAAVLVRAHAAEVERMVELVASIERRVRALADELGDTVGAVVPDLPRGHRDWLEVPALLGRLW